MRGRSCQSFCLATLAICAALAMPALAAEEPSRSRLISAAIADASESLRRQVLEAHFAEGQTVQEVARQLGVEESVARGIQSAGQRGGPRSPDGQTFEVRLELAGAAIADAIAQAPQAKRSALPAQSFDAGLSRLRRQTFSALGISTTGASLPRLRPASAAWRDVPEPARIEALNAARTNAVTSALESVRSVSLGDGKTADDAFSLPGIADRLREWLAAQPITGIQFDDNLEVRLKLDVPANQFWAEFQQSLAANRMGPAAGDLAGWDRMRDEFGKNVLPATGRSIAAAQVGVAAAATSPAPDVLPQKAPAWAGGQLDADGESQVAGLKGAREAEGVALQRLRAQLHGLTLKPGVTVADAAKDDPRVARAIEAALWEAKVSRVTYEPRYVTVRVHLELDPFWRSLSSGR